MATSNAPTPILSLDGGGVKGLFHLMFLHLLEQKMKKPIRNSFEYIGGTSIGGIFALILTHPLKWLGYRDDFYLQELLDTNFHTQLMDMFFSPPPYLIKFFGLLDSRYSYQMKVINAGLKDHIFGSDSFGKGVKNKTMIFAHNVKTNSIKVFKSWKHHEYYLYTIARATSAAPVFFPAVCIEDEVYIDGAIAGANNPTIFMMYEATLHNPTKKMITLSLGTSEDANSDLDCTNIGSGSIKSWIKAFIPIIMAAPSRAFEYLSGRHYTPEKDEDYYTVVEKTLSHDMGYCGYYTTKTGITFRFKPKISFSLDSTAPENLKIIQNIAKQFFEECPDIIDKLIQSLQEAETSTSSQTTENKTTY